MIKNIFYETKKYIFENKLTVLCLIILNIFLKIFFRENQLFYEISTFFSILSIGFIIFKLEMNNEFRINILLFISFYLGYIFKNNKIVLIGLIALAISEIISMFCNKNRKNIIFLISTVFICYLTSLEIDISFYLQSFFLCSLFFTLDGKKIDDYLFSDKVLIILISIFIFFITLNIDLSIYREKLGDLFKIFDTIKNIILSIFNIFFSINFFIILKNIKPSKKINSNKMIKEFIIFMFVMNIPVILIILWPLLYIFNFVLEIVKEYYICSLISVLLLIFVIYTIILLKEKLKLLDYFICFISFIIIGACLLLKKIPEISEFEDMPMLYFMIISLRIVINFIIFLIKCLLLKNKKLQNKEG